MRAILAVSVLMTLTACQAPPAEMTEAEKAQIEAQVLAATDVYTDALEAKDAEILKGILHPTETSWVWGGTIRDYTTFPERLATLMEPWETWEGGWTQRTVKVLSPEAVMFQGEYEVTTHYEDGSVLHWPGNANVTALFELTADGWKITMADFDNGASEVVEEG
jgi:hypothetical protein